MNHSKKDPQYERWNTTSLSHLFIILSGVNGEEAKNLAYNHLKGFIDYVDNGRKLNGFVLEKCPSTEFIIATTMDILKLPPVSSIEERRKQVYHENLLTDILQKNENKYSNKNLHEILCLII